MINTVRIIAGIFFLLVFISELHGIASDPGTYERVYTGAFMGERAYRSLLHLKATLWIYVVLTVAYLGAVALHLTMFRRDKSLRWALRLADMAIITFVVICLCRA